ncbi:phosphoribosylglycinamide synthetase [Hyphococcus sp.]|uniref:phosphoribosylglycinamide synthetase n=1 Tax=Hyphococcus sp. TaxID=2038636 RepID=UPI003CCC10D1
MQHGPLLRLNDAEKKRLKIVYLAKWAEGDGTPDKVDGTHATYHAEMRETLRALGYNVEAASKFERLYANHDYDFLFTMLNRGGFVNSEIMGPLLSTYNRIPYFGASPILRGLGDDKHLMKCAVRNRGVKTPDWMILRRGGVSIDEPGFEWKNLVVKPNASSASWGIGAFNSWADAKRHAQDLLAQGHDVIIENLVEGYEIAVPIIGSNGPWVLPPLRFYVDDPLAIRSYAQKRHLDSKDTVRLEKLPEGPLRERVIETSLQLLPEVWPCDIGRVELKYDEKTDTLNFIEINLSCNLWSKKATAISAATIGVTHPQLLETLLCHSLRRQGVVAPEAVIEYPITTDDGESAGGGDEW